MKGLSGMLEAFSISSLAVAGVYTCLNNPSNFTYFSICVLYLTEEW